LRSSVAVAGLRSSVAVLVAVLVAALLSAGLAAPAFARPAPGIFAGVDLSRTAARGSSTTRDGGASFAGGGIVGQVRFGAATEIGAHLGYRLDPSWSVFLGYRHARGAVRWNAAFPLFAISSHFAGTASSDMLLASVGYEAPLSGATSFRATAGIGPAFNRLSSVVETDEATALFLAELSDRTRTAMAARLGVGIRHAVAGNVRLGLDAAATYAGGFRTGASRTGNLGVTDITPYAIDRVWRGGVGAVVEVGF